MYTEFLFDEKLEKGKNPKETWCIKTNAKYQRIQSFTKLTINSHWDFSTKLTDLMKFIFAVLNPLQKDYGKATILQKADWFVFSLAEVAKGNFLDWV